jgi:hypothetical protein
MLTLDDFRTSRVGRAPPVRMGAREEFTSRRESAATPDAADGAMLEPERAFHSVHDLVHYAILSQPNNLASLRMIYSICQREGRIASKHGGGSRLITSNEHWKSQIRHALYTSPRFKRMGSDDWGVAAGHTVMPDTTVVYVSKDERVNAAGALAASRYKAPAAKKRRAQQTRFKTQTFESDYRSSAEPETVSMLALEGEKALKLMRSASGHSGSDRSAASAERTLMDGDRLGRAQTVSPSPRRVSRSCSPEPRESSTLVVVAGLFEQDCKVIPRDYRRNRRKPAGGGHHAAMPTDLECQVSQSMTPAVGADAY